MKGPSIVVVTGRGRVVDCFFHLTRAAAERRAARIKAEHARSGVKARAYDLLELLQAHDASKRAEVDELERMAKL